MAFLFIFLLSELPLSSARQADDGDDDGDDDDGQAVENAVKIAEQAGNEVVNDFVATGPAVPEEQVQPSLPTLPPAPTKATSPATVNMVSSLNRFG